MKEHHEKLRVKWATERMTWKERKCNSVVWSDEKKFNLDGPDELAYKWHDLRKQKKWFSKRHSGGASVMVWACFAGTSKSPLVFLGGKQDGTKYVTFEDTLLPFAEDLPLSWGFMQDGAPCHRARVAKRWLFDNFISVLEWPPYSPDLNAIENLWGILVTSVYSHQRQFNGVDSLSECIRDAWDEINNETLDALVKSMQKRCVEVLLTKGKKIDY
ncbi:unnamed protein product [Chondrus crispus]|uniref:Tc1-like transposase DDE domain-containing protein n=1 Tax=Chondrus crispus TaxID=2769 RepID=R7Q539_CHOCR|nr:unnamed protein product [Chondrus crispus]CDF32565.1 unnamed protein product [Chondrus crispus]|eukprot:XP_005712230.1 unnamed protein product [Chondrus crispus]